MTLFPFFLWTSFNYLSATEPLRETVYFLPLTPPKVVWVIWSTLEGWKAESTLEPPGSLYLEMVASNAHIPSATLLFTLKNCKRLQKLCAYSANDHVLQSFEFFFWWQDLSFLLFASLW